MAAPEILNLAWANCAVGGTAVAIVYFDRALTGAQISLDAGVTWHGPDDGPQALPTIGGTIQVDALDEEAPNRVTVAVTSPTVAGSVPYLLRGVNDDGAGSHAEMFVNAFVAVQEMAAALFMTPHGDRLIPYDIESKHQSDGFVVAYAPAVGTTGLSTYDFGAGVVFDNGGTGWPIHSLFLVEYSPTGTAVDGTVFQLDGLGFAASDVTVTLSPDGAAYYVCWTTAAISGVPTLRWRKHDAGSWTDAGSARSRLALLAVDSSDLTLDWGLAAGSSGTWQLAVQEEGDLLLRGTPPSVSGGISEIGGSTVSPSAGSSFGEAIHVIKPDGTYDGFWQVVHTTGLTLTMLHTRQPSPLTWVAWPMGSSGTGTIRRYDADGTRNDQATVSADSGATGVFQIADGEYNGQFKVRNVELVSVGLVGTTPVWSARATSGSSAVEWGGNSVGTYTNNTRLLITTGPSGATALAVTDLDPGISFGGPHSTATVGDAVAFAGTVTTEDGAASIGLIHQGGQDVGVALVDSQPGVVTSLGAARVENSTNEAPRRLAAARNEAGGWVIVNASSSGAPVIFDPPGESLTPPGTQTYMVSNFTADGEWATATVGTAIPPDPSVPVPPTTPGGDVPENLPEGDTLSVALVSFDPNAIYGDLHPDPVVDLTVWVRDSLTGAWRSEGKVPLPGDGELELEQDGAGKVAITLNPHSDFDGVVSFAAYAVSTTEAGVKLYSNVTEFTVEWLPEPDPPSIEEATFPDTWEDTPVLGVFRGADPDTGDVHTWRLSPQVEEPYTTTSTSAVTVYDASDPATVAGVVQIIAGQGTLNPTVVFTPALNYHGTFEGSVRLEDPVFQTDWRRFSGKVVAVPDEPGEITPGSVEVAEDSSTQHAFSFEDGDVGDARYHWQVSPNGSLWFDDYSDGTHLVARLDEEDDDEDTEVEVTLEPRANYVGTTSFWLRCRKTVDGLDGEEITQYTTRRITVTVTPVPDAPSAPTPTRMPTVLQGQTAVQVFTTVDPDAGDTAVFRVRRIGSTTWETSTLSLGAGVGSLTVTQGSTSDRQAVVRFTPAAAFRGRYSFEMQVIDGDGLTSPIVRVTGVVGARGLYAELVRLERAETEAELVPLGPLPMLDPSITWSVTGTDGASCSVEGAVVRRLAQRWEVAPDELLAPWAVELHIWGDGLLQFAGPVRRREYDWERDRYDLEVRGLAAYLEKRQLEDSDAAFDNVEQAEIIAALIDAEQARSYGDLLIDTSTAAATGQNRTVKFPRGTSIAECIGELQDQLDGPEVRITAERELEVAMVLGTDRRDGLVFTPDNTAGLRLEEDGDSITTIAQVAGLADDENPVYGSSAADTSTLERYGRICAWVEADRVGTEGGADAAADRLINTRGGAGRTIAFTHVARPDAPLGRGAWDYNAGDVCTMRVPGPRGELVAHGRIITRQLRPASDPQSGYLIQLTVELLGPDGVVRPARGPHGPEFLSEVWDMYGYLS